MADFQGPNMGQDWLDDVGKRIEQIAPGRTEPTLEGLNQAAIDLGLVTVEQVTARLEHAIMSTYYYITRRERRGIITPTDLAKRQEMAAMARAIILLRKDQR